MRNPNFLLMTVQGCRQIWLRGLLIAIATLSLWTLADVFQPQTAAAYPFYAQQGYSSPREATGRIVCANCHLASKPTEIEVPHSVLPDTVFKAVVKVPYDKDARQVYGDGSTGPLNVGAVLMLPEGFKIAPPDRIPEELQEEVGNLYFQPYSEEQDNIVLVGPIPGDEYQEIVFPVLSPDPSTDKSIHFGKYSIHVGGNRGRGQLYPTGEKTNNNVFTATAAGTVTEVQPLDGGGYQVTIQPDAGDAVVEAIPAGPELIVSVGQTVTAGEALTNNPNVGGFGQHDTEIVLQSAARIQGLMVFIAGIILTQIFLVLKKKQIEKVQAAEMNF